MGQDNFRKCFTSHRFNEIFQCVRHRRMNTNSRIFSQKLYSKLLKNEKYRTNISQAQNVRRIFHCGMTKASKELLLRINNKELLE